MYSTVFHDDKEKGFFRRQGHVVEDIYEKLARHLDEMPSGFPATESGVEMQILRRLFSPREAALALYLNLMPKDVKTIARRAGLPLADISCLLEGMAQKGLILRTEKEGRPVLFGAAQYVIGIWEYQVNNLDPELIQDMNAYMPTLMNLDVWEKAPQLRTIPVGRSVTLEREVLSYEQAEALVRDQERRLVAPCICRREHTIMGTGCGKPEESCLVFGLAADFYQKRGIGRIIDEKEALDILDMADDSGMVLQPSNAQSVANICCCCGCCCQVLKTIKRHPAPAQMVISAFLASVDRGKCEACGTCVSRCQMDALHLEEDSVCLDTYRCIGCGLCVTTCPAEALALIRKPDDEQRQVPRSVMEALKNLRKTRASLGLKRP